MTTCSAHIRYSDKCPNCRDMANNEYTAQVERDRNDLAVSHAELVEALDLVLNTGYEIPPDDGVEGEDWGITAETRVAAQAALTKARILVPEKPTCS